MKFSSFSQFSFCSISLSRMESRVLELLRLVILHELGCSISSPLVCFSVSLAYPKRFNYSMFTENLLSNEEKYQKIDYRTINE